MAKRLEADASPEKRLFIYLLTRDISLVAAFLDLIDNSINAAVEPKADELKDAASYEAMSRDDKIRPYVQIKLTVRPDRVSISDNASGISVQAAENSVFKFGRADEKEALHDRLSVYGIGLKRAIFKLGNTIAIRSDHSRGGFDLQLDVEKWAGDRKTEPWKFPITSREPTARDNCGTTITVTNLHEEVVRRLGDGVFAGQLREAIARTYAFYMNKFVSIYVNDELVEEAPINIGKNHTTQTFELGSVSCAIAAGIGQPQGDRFRDRTSGWFVFCNGRTVISADKTPLTGWSTPGTGLPIFQPKHRPFVGIVFFVAEDPEELPWTTTKSGINEDSAVWQEAKRRMIVAAREVISFLDGRYTDEGTEVAAADLREAAQERVSVLSAAISTPKMFVPPARAVRPESIRVQYDAKVTEIKKIAEYLRNPGMSGSDVGRHTFNYFLRNEVGEK